MTTSDEDITTKIEKADKLRAQILEAQNKQTTAVVGQANEVLGAQLDAEIVELESTLAAAKDGAKASNVKAGVTDSIDAAKARMNAATKAEKARQAALEVTGESQTSTDTASSTATEKGV